MILLTDLRGEQQHLNSEITSDTVKVSVYTIALRFFILKVPVR